MKALKFYHLLVVSFCCLLVNAGEPIQDEISNYFVACLKGQVDAYKQKQTLKLSEVEAYQAQVWEAWCKANREIDEEKLPLLKELSAENVYKWNLPAELEPHAVMPFYYGKKGDQKPAEGWPFFIYLHGSGPKASEWATGLKLSSLFDDAPSAYFVPQIPNERNYYRWWQKSKQFAWERLLRQAFVNGEINSNRVYVFGISEGGYGSQRLAAFYADYWAGAGPMAGGEPQCNAPAENCANIAFSLRTGEQDWGFGRNMITYNAQQEYDSLQRLYPQQFIHRIELIPDRGHSIDYFPTTPWLKQFVRNPHPKHFIWEDFPMDGNYRKGFYNIMVQARAKGGDEVRTRYEMTVNGNDITLEIANVQYEVTQKEPNWGIGVKYAKKYTPVTEGKFTLYLCDELVDLSKKITLTINGKRVFKGKVKPEVRHMVNSCAAFYDPQRVFPAAIEVEL